MDVWFVLFTQAVMTLKLWSPCDRSDEVKWVWGQLSLMVHYKQSKNSDVEPLMMVLCQIQFLMLL